MARRLAVAAILADTAAASWIDDPQLMRATASRLGAEPLRTVVNLDLPPAERWLFYKSDPQFAGFKESALAYIGTFVPGWTLPILTKIIATLHTTFYPDYAEEMIGIAKGLDMDLGQIVLINLIYQLEQIGNTCPLKNTTGPCPSQLSGPGLCTGFVAHGPGASDAVWQGRNLDWNLDAKLLKYVMQVDYQKGNATLFTGVQIAGMVGVLHGVKKGGYSIQMNARDDGGNVLLNLLEQILAGGKEPTHQMRRAFETATDFKSAEAVFSSGHLANPAYFIMAGANHGEGAILTRSRTGLDDAWHLNEAPAKDTKGINMQPDWFRLQTNYDHWTAVPSYDDRRTPGVAHGSDFCGKTVDQDCVLKLMTTWPTQNHHTDVTSIMCPRTGFLTTTVWMPAPSEEVVLV